MYEFGHQIASEVMLFEAQHTTHYTMPGVNFRLRLPGDEVFGKKPEDAGLPARVWTPGAGGGGGRRPQGGGQPA
ncbi:MAG: hypothetical protein D6730_14455 [Bacteroidetes bacterium]|nr:MAG: hypothetical protein D6730_14455 [Bacteroidota bacterium]